MSRHAARSGQRRARLVAALTVLGVLIVTGTASALAWSHRGNEPYEDRIAQPSTPPVTPAPESTYVPDARLRPGMVEGVPDDVGDRKRAKNLAKRVEAAARRATPAQFRVASFNVLGSSHTTARGNAPRFAAGPTRIVWALQALRGAGVDVAGLQEYERNQHDAFMRATGGSWAAYPGTALGNNAIRNSIVWRKDIWDTVRTETVPIPYFRGRRVPMPYVLLEHKETGRQVWFINIHNPTSNRKRGNNERWRDVGTAIEANLLRDLSADGTPVILTGDFNERAEAFCKVTAVGAVAANGGQASPCRPPLQHGIDWIFGAQVEFSAYARLQTPLVRRTSDHPLIAATVLAAPPKP